MGAGAGIDESKLVRLETGPAPWNAGVDDLPDRFKPAGLNPLGAEGEVVHIHQHMDIYVNGKRTTIPTGVGIYGNQFLTELHTHDSTGLLHVDPEEAERSTWASSSPPGGFVSTRTGSAADCKPGHAVAHLRRRRRVHGDPGELQLKKHRRSRS